MTVTVTADSELLALRHWSTRARALDLGSLVVTGLASVVYLITLVTNSGGLGGYLGILVTVVGVALARRYLWTGTFVVVLGSFTASVLGTDPVALWTIAVFTAFSAALRGKRGAVLGTLVGICLYVIVVFAEGEGFTNPIAFTAGAMALTAAAAGSALQTYLRLLQEKEQRRVEAIASREAETHQRIAEERVRIARDLHDVVGHEIAMLGIHLGVAEVSLTQSEESTRTALNAARASMQSVLLETQRILHVLRSTTPGASDSGEAGAPPPDFGRIPDLVSRYRDAGAEVHTDLCPTPTGLDPAVSAAAYRIVQESLTNAQRHGGGPVTLSTGVAGSLLTVTVTNAHPAGTVAEKVAGRRGLGLIGMRERAQSAGGSLEIQNSDTTFRVRAVLSINGSRI